MLSESDRLMWATDVSKSSSGCCVYSSGRRRGEGAAAAAAAGVGVGVGVGPPILRLFKKFVASADEGEEEEEEEEGAVVFVAVAVVANSSLLNSLFL